MASSEAQHRRTDTLRNAGMDSYSAYVYKDLTFFGSFRPLLSRIAMFNLYIQMLEVVKPGNFAMQLCVGLLVLDTLL